MPLNILTENSILDQIRVSEYIRANIITRRYIRVGTVPIYSSNYAEIQDNYSK